MTGFLSDVIECDESNQNTMPQELTWTPRKLYQRGLETNNVELLWQAFVTGYTGVSFGRLTQFQLSNEQHCLEVVFKRLNEIDIENVQGGLRSILTSIINANDPVQGLYEVLQKNWQEYKQLGYTDDTYISQQFIYNRCIAVHTVIQNLNFSEEEKMVFETMYPIVSTTVDHEVIDAVDTIGNID